MVSSHGKLDLGRTLPPLPGHGTTRLGFGTAPGACECVQSVLVRRRLDDAWLDEAVKMRSTAVLQSGVQALWGIGCRFQPRSLAAF